MEELINLIVEIANLLKYSTFWNRNKDFSKTICDYSLISDDQCCDLRREILSNINSLKKINGQPQYALLQCCGDNWYKVTVVNTELKFCCRLRDMKVCKEIVGEKLCVKLF